MRIARILALFALLIAISGAAYADAEPPPFVPGSWTLAVLPDTQNYAKDFPDVLTSQTRWIVEHRIDRNVAYVLTVGDLTNNNNPPQWGNFRYSMSLLDGVVPYVLVTGNHDYGTTGTPKVRDTLLNVYFPAAMFKSQRNFGGTFEPDKLENAYYFFAAGGREWLVIALEYGPRAEVVQWAGQILDKYPDRSAILLTHSYLLPDGTRSDINVNPKSGMNPHNLPFAKLPGGVNDGEELWQKLASQHANVVFVLSGHELGKGALLTSTGVKGNRVHQLFANYQNRDKGGEGYLRLMEFLPDGKTVSVKTYSPHLDKYMTDDRQQFTLDLPPAP